MYEHGRRNHLDNGLAAALSQAGYSGIITASFYLNCPRMHSIFLPHFLGLHFASKYCPVKQYLIVMKKSANTLSFDDVKK